ncbi:thioredoxin fold domain-containing protein [Cytophagales bacterium LB-30]|uniref:Thioredoxin fold domain-containing protein n=1 Tax=Shiella aurantiaca TaxID=3058365 RepID=A0ABT8F509_9BACT|nr:thioredoxin fold domain-containing protein [Shiella aurantiaca]MDN4165339.1 thioredoxin fold domain-containing protein [Shiella aurantiaca]
MRYVVLVLFITFALSALGYVYWQQELQYTQPTPKPAGLVQVAFEEKIDVSPWISPSGKPVFLHFFSPECPCSKFNAQNFAQIHNRYSDAFDFYVIIPNYSDKEEAAEFLPEGIQIIQDETTLLSSTVGVYSTPQAVLIDSDQRLFYRGNYNKSRYCTLPESNYALQAAEALTQRKPIPSFDAYATVAYGCVLPSLQL